MDEKRLVEGTTALAEKQSRIIKIEPTERPQNVRLRIAAYTRVSSDSEDQLNSFAAQNRYYTELISGKAEWRMVDIYADEGISGTSVAKRDDFQRMMADCRRGLIDQILVKSISRFARNTKGCLQNIRELKELGVNVRFAREGIDTANMSSELITAIYAAFAQKESESISGNMRWSYQRSMEQGTFNTYYAPVGFTLIDGNLQINQAEAPTIQRIFTEYLSGNNSREIAASLNKEKALGRHWRREAILRSWQDHMCPLGKGCCGGCGGVLKRTVPRYGRLLSTQCTSDAGFLAVVRRHAGTAWRRASPELDAECCHHGGGADDGGAALVYPTGRSEKFIQVGPSAND